MAGQILLIIFSFVLVLFAATATILPLVPGVPIAWLGLLLFAYATKFVFVTWKVLFIFLGFSLLVMLLEVLAPMIGAKKYQASYYGIFGSMFGLLVGVFIFGPLGIVIGPFLGALLGELWQGKDPESAMQSAKGALIGFLAGSAIKLALIMVMLGFLIYALF